jgi:hypothetical protein
MSRSSGFEFTYSLRSFLSTIQYENYWGISDPNQFKKEQENNLIAAIEDIKSLPSGSISNEELIDKLDSIALKVKKANDLLSKPGVNDFRICLKEKLERFSEALEKLHSKAKDLPIWFFTYKHESGSTYKHPLNYYELLLEPTAIEDALKDFYEHAKNSGFEVDRLKEECSDDDIVIKFDDWMQKEVKEEMQISVSLIQAVVKQDPSNAELYIRGAYNVIRSQIIKIKDQRFKKYPFIEKSLLGLRKWIEMQYPVYISGLKTNKLPGNDPVPKLRLLLKGQSGRNAVREFHQAIIQKYIDPKTSLPQLRQVLNGEDFTEKIVWLGGNESLYYIITKLKKEGVLAFQDKNQWNAVVKSFIKPDHQDFAANALKKNRPPSDTTELDKICQILIRAKEKEIKK